MAAETWLASAAGALLALLAGIQLLALVKGREEPALSLPSSAAKGEAEGPGRLVLGLRIGAALLAAAALLFAARTQGAWLPTERGQLALSLLLATQIAQLGLVAWSGRDGSGPVVDLASLGLLVLAVVFRPNGAPLACAQRSAAFYAQWIHLIAGAGAAVVAGSTALRLALSPFQGACPFASLKGRPGAKRREGRGGGRTPSPFQGARPRAKRREGWGEGRSVQLLLQRATWLAALLLAVGFVVGAAWAWRTTGALVGREPPGGWMALSGLLAAMSLLAWQLEKRPVGWAAILAVLSTVSVLIGLLS